MDDPPRRGNGTTDTASSSPALDAHQISSDPEPDADDWDVDAGGTGARSLALDEVDWDDVNDEVEAAMNESDSEEDHSVRAGGSRSASIARSVNASEDEGGWTDETNSVGRCVVVFLLRGMCATCSCGADSTTPRMKRKRLRSMTPTEAGINGGGYDADVLRSPLAKRKKIAADRRNSSKLKEAISMDELADADADLDTAARPLPAPMFRNDEEDEMDQGDDEDDDGDDEDDFLARELEEELG